MIKILTNSFDFKQPTIRHISSSGIIDDSFIKSASVHKDIDLYLKSHLKRERDRSKFHILFLGAGEYYSSNKNGDWFGRQDLINKHKTFEDFGHVFRHHVNKDPKKKYGDIDYVIYNSTMHRVEGIISLIESKNQDVLEKYESGEDIPVSMAAKLKSDECSICHHRSKSVDEYCDHLKFEMNKIYLDGSKVYAINPDPIFFDISLVWRPADPTAYFFSKVASHGFQGLSAEWGDMLYFNSMNKIANLDEDLIEKRALIKKLADLEKHIEGIITGKVDDQFIKPLLNVKHCVRDFPHSVLQGLRQLPFDKALTSLADHKIMLSLPEFLSLIGQGSMFDRVQNFLPGSFSRMLGGKDNDLLNLDFNLNTGSIPIYGLIKKFLSGRQLDNDFFKGKTIVMDLNQEPKSKIILGGNGIGLQRSSGSGKIIIKTSSDNVVADRLAKIYNLYKVAFCKKVTNKTSLLYSILSNY